MNFKSVGTKYIHELAASIYSSNYTHFSPIFSSCTISMLACRLSATREHENIMYYLTKIEI